MTNLESKQALATKLNIDYSTISANEIVTDADLQRFINAGVLTAWDFKPWPFTKGTKTTISIDTEYYDHPSTLMQGSIYLLKMGGVEFDKKSIEDYLGYLENDPSGTDPIWAEHEGFIFANQNAYTVGDRMDLYGKKLAPTLSADADLLPFSPIADNSEYSGNGAIVQLAYAEALASKKFNDPQGAIAERTIAMNALLSLWKPFADSKALSQSKNRPMFDVPDYFGNGGFRAGNF